MPLVPVLLRNISLTNRSPTYGPFHPVFRVLDCRGCLRDAPFQLPFNILKYINILKPLNYEIPIPAI